MPVLWFIRKRIVYGLQNQKIIAEIENAEPTERRRKR